MICKTHLTGWRLLILVNDQRTHISAFQYLFELLITQFVLFSARHKHQSQYDQEQRKKQPATPKTILLFHSSASLLVNLNHSDVRKIAVFLGIVQTVAYYKLIRNGETGIIYFNLLLHTALRLVKQGAQVNALRPTLL